MIASFFQNHKVAILGVVVGGILGYAYYYFIGCSSGSCAITSKPLNSTAYGMIMGYLAFSAIQEQRNQKENQK